jgi:hypothetical protein
LGGYFLGSSMTTGNKYTNNTSAYHGSNSQSSTLKVSQLVIFIGVMGIFI